VRLTRTLGLASVACVLLLTVGCGISTSSKEDLTDTTESTPFIEISLTRGTLTDNGATPWYAEIGLGTPPQKLKYMLDTGTTNLWVTSTLCDTDACTVHSRFDSDASESCKILGDPTNPTAISFGPWGTMDMVLARDVLELDGETSPPLSIDVTLSLATRYEGSQFKSLACDGGLPLGSTPTSDAAHTQIVPELILAGEIEAPVVSFWFDPESEKGVCMLGGLDDRKYEASTLNIVETTPMNEYSDLWIVPVARYTVGAETILTDVPLALDTGSSRFKGDPELIDELRSAITDNGRLPDTVHGENPNLDAYPTLELEIGGEPYTLEPSEYFLEVSPGERKLGFHEMEGLNGILLVGSLLLDHHYSVFYFETDTPGTQAIGLAKPRIAAD